MWDAKRRAIWMAAALIAATFFAYQNARDEQEGFDPRYFALLEVVFVGVISVMFYFYARRKS
jgi:hypothetical protein